MCRSRLKSPKTFPMIRRDNLIHNGTCLARSMIIVTGVSLHILVCAPGSRSQAISSAFVHLTLLFCAVMVFTVGCTMPIHLEGRPSLRIGAWGIQTATHTLLTICHPQACPWPRHHRLRLGMGTLVRIQTALHHSHASRMAATSAVNHLSPPQSILDSAQKATSQQKWLWPCLAVAMVAVMRGVQDLKVAPVGPAAASMAPRPPPTGLHHKPLAPLWRCKQQHQTPALTPSRPKRALQQQTLSRWLSSPSQLLRPTHRHPRLHCPVVRHILLHALQQHLHSQPHLQQCTHGSIQWGQLRPGVRQ